MIELDCSECGKRLKVDDRAAGKRGKCPQCGAPIVVPRPDAPILDSVEQAHAPSLQPKKRRPRYWLMVLIVLAAIAGFIAPWVTLAAGVVLLVLVGLAFVPKTRGLSRRVLRLTPGQRFRTGLRLVSFGTAGIMLLLISARVAEFKANREELAVSRAADKAELVAKRTAEEAERQRLAMEANEEVISLVHQAKEALRASNIDAAKEKLNAAARFRHATPVTSVDRLRDQVDRATQEDHIRSIMLELSDEEFAAFRQRRSVPEQLHFGYPVLDATAEKLARAQLVGVKKERKQRRQAQLEAEREREKRERAAAEEKRKEQRKKRIEEHFSSWDGSHDGLTKVIKASMNNPDSYKHVETVFWDKGDYVIVRTTFRGTNAFNAVVTNWVKAKVDLDGNVIEIMEKGP